MRNPDLTVETVGTILSLSEPQTAAFARTIYGTIRQYIETHKEEYEAWERIQERTVK